MIYIIDPLNEVFRLSLFTVFFGIFLDTTVGFNTLMELIKKDQKLYFKGLKFNGSKVRFLFKFETKALKRETSESNGHGLWLRTLFSNLIITLFLSISFMAKTLEGRFKISFSKYGP